MTTAICVHPYVLFFQFLTCLSVFLVYLNKFAIKKFLTIIIDVIISFVIGGVPLLTNFIKVKKLYGSFDWATGLIIGERGTAETITSIPTINTIVNSSEYSLNSVFDYFIVFYNEAVKGLFGPVFTPIIIFLFMCGFALSIYLIIKDKNNGKHYLVIVICAVFYIVLY